MTAFIGRSRELNALDVALTKAAQGDGNFLLISGAAGIGKSRLVRETQRRAQAGGFVIVEGSCEEPDRDVAFAGIARLLRNWLQRCSLEAFVEELGGAAGQIACLLPELRQHGVEEETVAHGTAICEAVGAWLGRVAEGQPLLLTLEDIHWSDQASLACLMSSLQQLTRKAALVLVSVRNPRPDGDSGGGLERMLEEAGARHLRLAPLSRPEVAMVMRSVSGTSQLPPFYFLKQVFDMTGGNPLFVEELCLSSTATDTVSRETDLLGLHPRPQTIIPRSMRRIIRQRLQAVSMEAQVLAGLGAAHGRVFDLDLLQALMGYSEAQIQKRCEELVAAHLAIAPDGEQPVFRHALIREAIYDRLLVRERRALHERLAVGLEKVYGDCLDEHLAELSYHSYKAGCWEMALRYCGKAAELASSLGAPQAAVAQLTRAIEAASWLRNEPVWQLFCRRGQALEQLGEWDRALTDYVTALDSVRSLDDKQIEAKLMRHLETLLTVLPERMAAEYYGRMVAEAKGESPSQTVTPV